MDTPLVGRFSYKGGIRSNKGGLVLLSERDLKNQVRSWDVHRMVEPGPLGTFPVLFFSSYAL